MRHHVRVVTVDHLGGRARLVSTAPGAKMAPPKLETASCRNQRPVRATLRSKALCPHKSHGGNPWAMPHCFPSAVPPGSRDDAAPPRADRARRTAAEKSQAARKALHSTAHTFWLSPMHPFRPGMPQISKIWYMVPAVDRCFPSGPRYFGLFPAKIFHFAGTYLCPVPSLLSFPLANMARGKDGPPTTGQQLRPGAPCGWPALPTC